jgi:hypothetical protein
MKDPKLLDLYSDYLMASFRMATATDLSELTDQALSHDKISRFLGQEEFTSKDYWRVIKPLVRKVEHCDAVIKIEEANLSHMSTPLLPKSDTGVNLKTNFPTYSVASRINLEQKLCFFRNGRKSKSNKNA